MGTGDVPAHTNTNSLTQLEIQVHGYIGQNSRIQVYTIIGVIQVILFYCVLFCQFCAML